MRAFEAQHIRAFMAPLMRASEAQQTRALKAQPKRAFEAPQICAFNAQPKVGTRYFFLSPLSASRWSAIFKNLLVRKRWSAIPLPLFFL